ncbi:MAG TPA: transcriptional regulator [Sphingomonadaceae bacterium]|nr:transcriptional regulator [Sphingomonadaceae bacterium]
MTDERIDDGGGYRFDRFRLDARDRRLSRDGAAVELNARYFDALLLLVRRQGQLVSKERFLDEVWRGVPVTDEALTQCIKTLRRQLGDNAASPRFIETVPKHGYRFIAPVAETAGEELAVAVAEVPPDAVPVAREAAPVPSSWQPPVALTAAGTAGGGVAGVLGGMVYGFLAAPPPLQPGMGAVSVLLVLVCLTIALASAGAAGVAAGIAAAERAGGHLWQSVAGGAGGGLVVGGLVKLIGLDAFDLLFGRSPGDITGAAEGALLGGAVGLGACWARRRGPSAPLRRGVAVAALAGGIAGMVIALTGGRLLGGSLHLLAASFPGSRLRLDSVGALFGESGLGPVSLIVTAGLEGALFGGCVVGAMTIARRGLRARFG